ncbi:hypothetical protein IJ114_00960 [Candidatus Saccharibacteria bacterium]|nr:hypothetical protein [Candidatus Saccharibacteria bacterium]
MQNKLRKIKYNIKHDFPLDKFLFVVALLFFAACVWGTISSVARNWELEQRVSSRQKELRILELEVESAELENQYYASEEYQELAARAKQNKMYDGEIMVYLPKNTERAKTKHQSENNNIITQDQEDTRTNFEKWMSFLFGA